MVTNNIYGGTKILLFFSLLVPYNYGIRFVNHHHKSFPLSLFDMFIIPQILIIDFMIPRRFLPGRGAVKYSFI